MVPHQSEDLIIGRPWLRSTGAVIYEKHGKIAFEGYDAEVYSNDYLQKHCKLEVKPISAAAYTASILRSKKRKAQDIQFFAASLHDIEKALTPKPKITREEIMERLPRHYTEFIDVFDPIKANTLPPHRPGIDQEIQIEKDETGNDRTVPWGPLYNMSRQELLVLRQELNGLLDKDLIQVSKSPAGAPVLFARKPGGGLRLCIDYRGLNAITRKDRYPLPLIRETLAALNRAKWLTKLDVSAAFHKIRLAKGEEWKTAFRTRYGLYEWKVSPFGLTNSPATFQRFINWVLKDFLDDFCSAYVDDILIFSSGSLQDHRSKVRKVLQRLLEHGLQLDFKKCEFETTSTKYLGYIIDVGNGIKMDPEKLKAISEWQAPKSVKGVRSFLGFANYYRLFIQDYANIAKPLNDLTKKGVSFKWTKETEEAFQDLKSRFKREPILATYDPDKHTRVEPDASGWAVGGVLTQFDAVLKIWRPLAYYSTRHLPAECNYDIHDKELLAIVKCIKEWSSELRGLKEPFLVLTDHKNLEPFLTKRTLTERQVRWQEFLSQFKFKLQHRAGTEAVIPDALSRREQDVPVGKDDSRLTQRERTLLPESLWVKTTNLELPSPFLDDPQLTTAWEEAIQDDAIRTEYNEARQAILSNARTFPKHLELRLATGECDIANGFLRYRERIWLPKDERLTTKVIQKIHDSYLGGHPGRDVTLSLVSRQFF